MRTTLDLSEDVLSAAKEIGRRDGKSVGQVLSELARIGLRSSADPVASGVVEEFLGFRPLPTRGVVVTSELVHRLSEETMV
jgi:hypothetical protein